MSKHRKIMIIRVFPAWRPSFEVQRAIIIIVIIIIIIISSSVLHVLRAWEFPASNVVSCKVNFRFDWLKMEERIEVRIALHELVCFTSFVWLQMHYIYLELFPFSKVYTSCCENEEKSDLQHQQAKDAR